MEPVDNAWLVVFRIAFGLIMFIEVVIYFNRGLITKYYLDPSLFFPYYGFEWVKPWPGAGMYIHFAVMGVLALMIASGLMYRLATALFFLAFTHVFLIDQTNFLNHLYLICLLSFMMIIIPADRSFSLSVWFRPNRRRDAAPRWTLWLLRFQFGVVYFYGGIEKLNMDWLSGQPMKAFLEGRGEVPIVGTALQQPFGVHLLTWGGTIFDLLVVPMLLWKPTRSFTFTIAVAFHVVNSHLFQIGIFPWLMIVATTMYLSPDWPRRVFRKWKRREPATAKDNRRSRLVEAFLIVWVTVHLLMPLRHFLYPGFLLWTKEGIYFSWYMMYGYGESQILYLVVDPESGEKHRVDPKTFVSNGKIGRNAEKADLTMRQVGVLGRRPEMILAFAHHLAEQWRKNGYKNVQVYAYSQASLNGRKPQRLVDKSVNLAAEPRIPGHKNWIVSLEEPLPELDWRK